MSRVAWLFALVLLVGCAKRVETVHPEPVAARPASMADLQFEAVMAAMPPLQLEVLAQPVPPLTTVSGVTISTAQTITGAKTFSGGIRLTGALTVGTATPLGAGAAYFYSMATSTTPTEFEAHDVVIGRPAASGASSGALFFRYDNTNNRAFIGSLSPGTAWRDLRLGASSVIIQNASGVAQVTIGGSTNPGSISATGGVTAGSTISGAAGLRINTDGGGSKPACGSSIRGFVWYVQSGAGVADTFEVCTKDAADAYAWRSVY